MFLSNRGFIRSPCDSCVISLRYLEVVTHVYYYTWKLHMFKIFRAHHKLIMMYWQLLRLCFIYRPLNIHIPCPFLHRKHLCLYIYIYIYSLTCHYYVINHFENIIYLMFIYIYIYIYISLYIYIHIYIYIYTYIYIHVYCKHHIYYVFKVINNRIMTCQWMYYWMGAELNILDWWQYYTERRLYRKRKREVTWKRGKR